MMTREKIERAAKDYVDKSINEEHIYDDIGLIKSAARVDFMAGVEFANKHWQEKTKSNLGQLFSDAEFIENLCFSYRHDFGLLCVNKQILIRLECKEWLRAIINNWKEIE